jgi:hypothetical protein
MGARGTEKKCFCFVGRALFLWGEPFFVGEAQKQKNAKTKKTKTKKPKHFFWVGGQKEEYVIRKRGCLVLYFCSRKRNAKKTK